MDEAMRHASHVTLNYFLWLPSGKDEFGFEKSELAPLGKTAYYRTREPLENTISSYFADRVETLTDDVSKFAGLTPHTSLLPMDGELGLRKLHFGFNYRPSHPGLEGYLRGEQIPGTAVFLSNGLYLWSFRVPLRQDMSEEKRGEIKTVLAEFLRYDFIENHINHIFKFGWNPRDAKGRPDNYGGILTYYQLDLLFNGVFDQAAHPHLALGDSEPDISQSGPSIEEQAKERYAIRYLIQSLSLFAIDNEYLPIWDLRKRYTLRRTFGDTMAYVDTETNLSQPSLSADDDDLHQRELFLARVSFAAMEQFLRVAISFGLTYYKTGLDQVRSELISQGMQARKNRTSAELRRPSLRQRALMMADLETYYSLLVGKLPTLRFVQELVEGLSEVTSPSREVKANGVHGAVEYHFARGTLGEARTQFKRMVNAIKSDVDAIDSTLDAARADQMILELSESRKLTEITAETPRSGEVAITSGRVRIEADARLAVPLTFVGVVLGFVQIVTGLGVWLTGEAFKGTLVPSQLFIIIYWSAFVVLTALAGLGAWRYVKRQRRLEQERLDEGGTKRTENHVFDYSSLLRDVKSSDSLSAPLMASLRASMMDIENPRIERQNNKCKSFSTFHETPSSGIQRIKYSLEAPPSKNEVVYTLHIEFDRPLNAARGERLLDLRMVVRKPASFDFNVTANSHLVIADCVKRILFPRGSDEEIKTFCSEHFGWEPIPTA